jgi:predicted transcriptional regulator
VPVQIYMDPEDWAKLSELARMDDRSRSWLVRDLIHRALAEFDANGDRVAA